MGDALLGIRHAETRTEAGARCCSKMCALRPGLVQGTRARGLFDKAQLTLLRDYAVQERLEILQEFVDVETAKIAGRHSFNAMLALQGRLDAMYEDKLDGRI